MSHHILFSNFLKIVEDHGIILSTKKSVLDQSSINFLGMVIENGQYHRDYIFPQELLHFPDENHTKKQIQQFLGIVN